MRFLNRGDQPCTFRLTANAYQHGSDIHSFRVNPRDDREHFIPLKRSANWYDFTARVVGEETYSRRFAGHMETGRHSLSDPAMGGRARGQHG